MGEQPILYGWIDTKTLRIDQRYTQSGLPKFVTDTEVELRLLRYTGLANRSVGDSS